MVNSVLTNFGALVALQNLQSTQAKLTQTQNRISTGLKVNTAKDDAATWAISTQMKGSVANLQQVSANLSQTDSVLGTAVSGTSSIADFVSQIRAKVTAAQAPGADASKVQNDITQLVSQIQSTVDASSFNGINLLNNNSTQNFVSAVNTSTSGNSTPSYIAVAGANLNTSGTGLLASLSALTVVNRADALFNTTGGATTADLASGTKGLNLSMAAVATAATNAVFTTTYTDAGGTSRTLNTTIASIAAAGAAASVTSIVGSLNSDATFSSMFHASASQAGTEIIVSAANRSQQTGSFAVTAGAFSNQGGTTTLAADLTANSSTAVSQMTFHTGQDFQLGDQINIAYKAGGVSGTVTLQVTNDTSGTVESYNASTNTSVVSLQLSSVNGKTATQIASAVTSTLTGAWTPATNVSSPTNPFAAAAGASAIGVTSNAGQVQIKSSTTANDTFSLTFNSTYSTQLATVDAAASAVNTAAASLGSVQKRVETQKTFIDSLVSNLQAGVGNLVDADMSSESARLTALQVQQQLGTQALSIANQAPQNILSLFK